MTWKRNLVGALILMVLGVYLSTVGVRAVALAQDIAEPGLASVKAGEVAALFVPTLSRMGRQSGEGFGGLLFLILYIGGAVATLLSAGPAYAAPLFRRGRALGVGAALAAFTLPLLLATLGAFYRFGAHRPPNDQETLIGAVALVVLGCTGFWSAALVTCLVNRVEPWSRPCAGERAPELARVNGVSYAVCLAAPPLVMAGALYFGLVWNPNREMVVQCLLGDAPKVKALLASGASANGQDRSGRKPLTAAAASASVETVVLLLDAGAEVNGTDGTGATPLHAAARSSRRETVKLLLVKGAKADVSDRRTETPLTDACQDAETTRLLLDAGASPEFSAPQGLTPLMSACRAGNTEVVKLLFERGAKVNACGQTSTTPLICALNYQTLETARFLLQNGADQGPPVREPGRDVPGFSAMPYAASSGPDAILLLLEFGAEPDQWVYGRPLLHHAAQSGWLEVAKRLVEARVDINRVVPGQGTALDVATQYSRDEVRDYLASAGGRSEKELPAKAP